MKIIMFFSPTFLPWGKAIIKYWAKNNPEIEVIGLASSKKIYDALKNDSSLKFLVLDCMEDLERKWISSDYDPNALKLLEKKLGTRVVSDSVIVDRMLGHGYVSGANRIDAELSRLSFDDDKVRAYITNMYTYYEDLLNKYNPDFTFLYAIAGGLTHALSNLMENKSKHFFYLQHTRIDNLCIIDSGKSDNFSSVWQIYHSKNELNVEPYLWAKKWLNDYRDNQKLPSYMAYAKSQAKNLYSIKGYVKSVVKSLLRYFFFDVMKSKKSLHSPSGTYDLKTIIFAPFRRAKDLRRRDYLSYEEIEKTEFIYFPLHVDPEASTMRIAPDHTNQLAVIEALAKRKPLSMNLVVKENPNMVGLRPKGFYKVISNMPGVKIVHPKTNSLSLIKQAELTATISGTVAWEALITKKPILIIGNSPYLSFEKGIVYCPELHRLDEGITKALASQPLPDNSLLRFLSIVREESFEVPSDLYWGQISDTVMNENIEYAHTMADKILQRYNNVISSTSTSKSNK